MGKLSEMLGENIDNEASYKKMLESIQLALTTPGMHNMFVGVCDNVVHQMLLVSKLKFELKDENRILDLKLDHENTNLTKIIRKTIKCFEKKVATLPLDWKPVFSVTVADELSGSISELALCGGLQWSYLRHEQGKNKELENPNILWLNTERLIKVRRKAPDYCAHLKGCFYFDFEE